MSRLVRALIWVVLTVAVVVVAVQLLFELTTERQLFDISGSAAARAVEMLGSLSEWWLYPWLAGGVLGAFLALLVDSPLRRAEDTDSPIMLGWELRDLVRKIERFLQNVNTGAAKRIPPELESEVLSAMARLRRLGIVDPRSREPDAVTRLDMAAHFFSRIIPYLHNEQLKQARSLAKGAARSGEYKSIAEEPSSETPSVQKRGAPSTSPQKPRRRILFRKRATPRVDAPTGPDEVTEVE